jgi:hypothetical protein
MRTVPPSLQTTRLWQATDQVTPHAVGPLNIFFAAMQWSALPVLLAQAVCRSTAMFCA